MKKVLVTGGAGYIGAHTAVELIAQGFEPIIIDNFSKSDRSLLAGIEKITNKTATFYEGDCADQEFVQTVFEKEKEIACVMHFAAFKAVGESVQLPLMYYQNNINSLLAVLEAMKRNEVKNIIFSSSCTVYGEPDSIPVDESTPFKKAESPYGATKQMCERILEDQSMADNNFRIISLRYFNPIGAHPSSMLGELPLDVPGNLVPYITQTAAGIRKKLTVFGSDYNTPDGSCVRDYIHIVDLAQAHVAALSKMIGSSDLKSYEVFNLGTGLGVSVLELVNEFIKVTGIQLPFEIGARRSGDVEKTYANPAKAFDKLGWKTKLTYSNALLDAWNWQKKISKING